MDNQTQEDTEIGTAKTLIFAAIVQKFGDRGLIEFLAKTQVERGIFCYSVGLADEWFYLQDAIRNQL